MLQESFLFVFVLIIAYIFSQHSSLVHYCFVEVKVSLVQLNGLSWDQMSSNPDILPDLKRCKPFPLLESENEEPGPRGDGQEAWCRGLNACAHPPIHTLEP